MYASVNTINEIIGFFMTKCHTVELSEQLIPIKLTVQANLGKTYKLLNRKMLMYTFLLSNKIIKKYKTKN